ncbi:MAG TPA: hypothetical protein VM487_13715 [Phycisphaerae bacterium]|nr:hypothetical protein [Phycisphaerae bacterium]
MKPIEAEQHFPWYADPDDTTFIDCQCGAPCDGIAEWATHITDQFAQERKTMNVNSIRMYRMFDQFIETWGSSYLAGDLGDKLRCEEVDVLAGLLRAFGADAAADSWIASHALADECGDAHCLCANCATAS